MEPIGKTHKVYHADGSNAYDSGVFFSKDDVPYGTSLYTAVQVDELIKENEKLKRELEVLSSIPKNMVVTQTGENNVQIASAKNLTITNGKISIE